MTVSGFTMIDQVQPASELSKAEIMELERKLAKFSGFMDTLVRIPFTKQGVGADATLSTIPFGRRYYRPHNDGVRV